MPYYGGSHVHLHILDHRDQIDKCDRVVWPAVPSGYMLVFTTVGEQLTINTVDCNIQPFEM